MISCRFVPISCQKGVLFFETPGRSIGKFNFIKISWLQNDGKGPKQ